jgi:RimJ/RimL family protein N-acetyltransferase
MNLLLESKRLLLKPLAEEDVDICLTLFTDARVVQHAIGMTSEAEIRSQMSNWSRRGGNGCVGIWCITDKASGEKLGTGALLPMPIEDDNTDFSLLLPGTMPDADIEIGYFLKPSAWGRGYATEAACRLLEFAFQDSPLQEIVATFDEKNIASRIVLEKAGFRDRGTRHCYGEESMDFRISRDEWLSQLQPGGL